MARYKYSTECDYCGSSDAKAVYSDGTAFCFSCSSYFHSGETQNKGKKKLSTGASKYTMEEVEHFPFADLSHRGIKNEIVKKFGVRQSVDETHGKAQHIFYPSPDGGGYKVKHIKNKKDMAILGEYKGLFGKDKFPNRKMVVITEGEEDALSIYQMFQAAGKDYAVVSLPNGSNESGTLDKATAAELEWLRSHNTVVLALDNDEPGEATTETIAGSLATEVKVKVVDFQGLGVKDANEALMNGQGKDFLQAFYSAKDYQPEKLELGEDVPFEEVHKPMPKGTYIDVFPELMEKMQGLRPEEMTILLAPPGAGKTTVSREIVHSLLKKGEKVGSIFLEEKPTKTRQGLIAIDNNIPLWRYRQNPDIIMESEARKSYDNLIGNGNCFFVHHRGSLSDEALINIIKWYAEVQGVSYIVLDHISMVFSGRRSQNERQEIDGLLTDLAKLVEETGIHLIVVSHIKRQPQQAYSKDEQEDTKWQYIDLDAARGSGSFEQLAWNLITLEPEVMEDGSRGRTRVSVRKNREIGLVGPCDIWKLDSMTGRVINAATPEAEEY